ncbi:MAG: dihydrodipicolinate synthase family protein [Euryarchaeota archaeon]|nr:dihydrodipicolinate synthase family protein [Euryarchaeota archaeon]
MTQLKGVFVAMVTPFIGGNISRDSIARLMEYYKLKGLNGALVCGSTGEAHLMRIEEIKETIKTAIEFSKSDFKIIAGVLRSDTGSALEIAKFAEDHGASAVLALTPYYYGFSDEEILEHYSKLRDKLGIPLLLYNAPRFTGRNVSPKLIVKMLSEGIIDGIKDTVWDFSHFAQILAENGSIGRKDASLFVGTTQIFLPSLIIGASGAILASANYLPELCVKVYDCFLKGDLVGSREHNKMLLKASTAIEKKLGIPGIKAAMDIRGLPVGAPREPFNPLNEDQYKYVRKVLETVGVKY